MREKNESPNKAFDITKTGDMVTIHSDGGGEELPVSRGLPEFHRWNLTHIHNETHSL